MTKYNDLKHLKLFLCHKPMRNIGRHYNRLAFFLKLVNTLVLEIELQSFCYINHPLLNFIKCSLPAVAQLSHEYSSIITVTHSGWTFIYEQLLLLQHQQTVVFVQQCALLPS